MGELHSLRAARSRNVRPSRTEGPCPRASRFLFPRPGAEVVWRDPRTPKFIGDMPHTWVGSDYIRSALDMFAYERESDSSLVIGAGVPESWVRQAPGVRIGSLSTHYGRLSYNMRATGNVVRIH